MTTCIYSEGILYADRCGLGVSFPSRFIEIKKLYTTSCKRIAFAVSGSILDVKSSLYKKAIPKFRKQVLEAAVLRADFEITDDVGELFKEHQIIAMTKDTVFVFNYNYRDTETVQKFILADKDLPVIIGSGSDYASIALVANKTPKEAIHIAACVDLTSYPSSIDTIAMSDLK